MNACSKKKNGSPFLKGKARFGVLLIPLLLIFHRLSAQSVVHTETFSQSQLQTTNVTAPDGHTYTQLSYAGLSNLIQPPGSPAVPVKYVNLIVPRDRNFSSIAISTGTAQNISLSHQVYPVQIPAPAGAGDTTPPYIGPDPGTYGGSGPFPSALVRFVRDGYFDGNKHIITVAIYPMQYLPASSALKLYTSITLTVTENTGTPVTMYAIDKDPVYGQELYDNALPHLIANPQDISRFSETGNVEPKPSGDHVPFYEYVIITSKDLQQPFEELAGWKRRKGLDAGVVDIQDILNDNSYANGDVVSNINDDAGKLRQYLAAAYQHGTKYAVLGGDASIIPVRYAAGYDNSFGDISLNAHIPSDLYYTDFNGNWNVDNDQYYGEDAGDQVDYDPEIFVGRIIVKTEKQAVNHIYKIIRYERNPGRGDNDYVARAFFDQADELQDNNQANTVAAAMPFYSGNLTIFEEIPGAYAPAVSFPAGVDVIKQIKQYYGLVSIFGHGGPWGIAVGTKYYNQCPKYAFSSTDADPGLCQIAPYDGNGIDNLDDYDHIPHPYQNYPHIFYTVACETMPYDDEIGTNPSPYPHLGDAYTNGTKSGAAAYLGNTRDGWVGTSYLLQIKFADQMVQRNTQLGVAEGLSKVGFWHEWCSKTHALLGCPETDMWTGKPAQFERAFVSGKGTVTVNTGDGLPAKICIISALDNGQTFREVLDAASATFYNVPPFYAVCITRHNFVPFLYPSNTTIGNYSFTGTAYVGANELAAGNDPATNPPLSTPTTIKAGANVFFHAESGNINLGQEFTVEPGAAFEAK